MSFQDDPTGRRAIDETPDQPASSSVSKNQGDTEDSRATVRSEGGARSTVGHVGETMGHHKRHEDKVRRGAERVKSGHIEKASKE